MATVNKDFKIKSGLIVEGTTATVNGFDVLTKASSSDAHIIALAGGGADSANVANKVVKRDANGNFAAGTITADVTGDVTGDLTGNVRGNVTGTVSSLSNHDTADLAEGTNLYYTDARARGAIAAGTGIDYNSSTGYIDANLGTGLGLDGSSQIEIDRTTVDAWYDASGAAATVASNLTDHENATEAHGATGAVVGTTNTQTLTNKTIGDTLNFTGAGAMTINSDSHIVLTPAAGSSVKWGTDVLATQGYADQAETDAKAYTDTREGLITTAYEAYTDLLLGDATIDGTGGNTVSDRIDSAVADLVNGAPELLNTLNELAEAIGDSVDAQGLAVAIGNKLPLAGGSMSGAIAMGTNKITGLGTPTANTDASTKGYVDGEVTTALSTAQGYADAVAGDLTDHEALSAGVHGVTGSVVGTTDAQDLSNKRIIDALQFTDGVTIANEAEIVVVAGSHDFEVNAKSGDLALKSSVSDVILTPAAGYDVKWGADVLATQAYVDNQTTTDVAEGTNLYFTNQRAIDAVGGTIEDQINLIDTDDIEEGATNQYFTDYRAKVSAVDLLTNASKSNIDITWTNQGGLVIAAENGVADSDTDDLDEGTTNLYFTDVRAVDALEAVVPNFTAVEVNSLAKEVAVTATVSTPSTATALTWDTAVHRTVKALVKFATANHTEVSEVLLTLDGLDNIAITEYAMVGTNGSMGTITATVVAGEGRLNVTTLNNATVVFVKATLLV